MDVAEEKKERVAKPTVSEVEDAVKEILLEQEIAALSTLEADGHPSTSYMHFAADGFRVYMHCFTHNVRKFQQMRDDPRVSFTVRHSPPRGYYERFVARHLQIKGLATWVTSEEEIAHAAELSTQQFSWSADSGMYTNIRTPSGELKPAQQSFFRIDPLEGAWTDHRISMSYRVMFAFTPDGSGIETLRSRNEVLQDR